MHRFGYIENVPHKVFSHSALCSVRTYHAKQVFHAYNTDDMVNAVLIDRDSRKAAAYRSVDYLGNACRCFDSDDIRSVGHNIGNVLIIEAENVAYHFPLRFFNIARIDHHKYLFLGDFISVLGSSAEHAYH